MHNNKIPLKRFEIKIAIVNFEKDFKLLLLTKKCI